MTVYYAYINNFSDDFFASVYDMLPLSVSENIKKISFDKKRRESLLGWYLFLKGAEAFSVSSGEIGFSENGKPYLLSGEIFFNISHSDGLCICAFSKKNIGADCEKIRRVSDKMRLKVLSEKELELSSDESSFIRLWTLKESFVKYSGVGIQGIFQTDFSPYFYEDFFEKEGLFFRTVRIDEWFLSFCCEEDDFQMNEIIFFDKNID